MGTSTDAKLVYGIPLEEGAIGEWDDGDPEDGPAYLAYMGDESEDGIGLVNHCSHEYPMHILAIGETEQTAWRGSPVRIESLAAKDGWAAKLREYAERHKLQTAGEPGWWLCSWWG